MILVQLPGKIYVVFMVAGKLKMVIQLSPTLIGVARSYGKTLIMKEII